MERKNKKYDDITRPLYDLVMEENKAAFERSRSIDTRAGIFLTFLITAFPFYIQIIGFDRLKEILQQTAVSFAEILYAGAFFCSVAVFLLSIVFLVLTLCSRKFYAYNINLLEEFNLIKYEDADTTVNDITVALFDGLKDVVNRNAAVVDRKAKKFTVALWLSVAFVALMIGTILLTLL